MIYFYDFKSFKELEGRIVSFLNPFSYSIISKNEEVRKSEIVWFSDGFIICKIAGFLGLRLSRFSMDFTSLATPLFTYCQANDLSVAVIGSDQFGLDAFRENIFNDFKLDFKLASNGFISKDEKADFIKKLIDLKIDVLIVGLGTPLQECFLIEARKRGWTGTGYTCGGFITQTAINKGSYYPKLIDRLNLRFLYRMIKEPHTIKRYVFVYPVQVLKIFLDFKNGVIKVFGS